VNGLTLDNARGLAALTVYELWLRYFTLGGTETRDDLGRYLRGDLEFGDGQHDVVALALNERFHELDLDHLVPYADDVN